jgi:DNA gyrase subunit A
MMEKFENVHIIEVDLVDEMKKSYIAYSMSVIVGRALPDVKDGLKPVHRRILYTMHEAGFTPDKAYRKCATTVGDVLGKYHPHGDMAVYDSLVRMAQDFSLRYPLIDGHGNFGSVDGDSPAAYRYTESRLAKLSTLMLKEIDKETVDFSPNYDERLEEPAVLPSRFPNLLVNGSSGIAVGMATNIPPHNLTECINALCATIDNPEISIEELMAYIKGPDFPTSGIIMGKSGIRSYFNTGRGRVIVRARAEIEDDGHRQRIIVTELPYQVNKARLIEKIAEMVNEKRLDGISDINDESDRDGMRIVVDIKRDAAASVVLNNLYKYTQMQDTCAVIMLALVDNQPKVLNIREVLDCYIAHQKDVIVRRTKYDLKKAEARAHILEGLRIALDHIDEIISIIRSSYSNAKERLIERFSFTEIQAQAILDMRLISLQGLQREKIEDEYAELMKLIAHLNEILASEQMVFDIIKTELTEIKGKYGDERRTEIGIDYSDIDVEDLIEEEDVVITITHLGYIKRLPTDTYKTQNRGGRGISGLSTRDADFVEELFVTSTHNYILFFTNNGRMFKLKAYQIPEAGRTAKGTAIVNLLEFEQDEKISATIPLKKFEEEKFLFMATKNGVIKKTALMEYDTNRTGGRRAIELDGGDELIRVHVIDNAAEMVLTTYKGLSIRFKGADARAQGRVTRGCRGIRLKENDYLVGMSVVKENTGLLIVSENGLGKRTDYSEYKTQKRGGQGVKTYKITEKTGNVAGVRSISDGEDVMIITSKGVIIRIKSEDIKTAGRNTQGVILRRPDGDMKVVSIARAPREEETEVDAVEVDAETEVTENEGEE